MDLILIQLEHAITAISEVIWPVFVPFMLVLGAYMAYTTIFKIQPKLTKPSKMKFKNMIGPASISLGAMVGTGAIVGVLGALSKLYGAGQHNIEAIVAWAFIGALVMIPVSYSETVNSKIMKQGPKEYISKLISPKLGFFYAISIVALMVFGFGGFQFSGIDSVFTIVASQFMGIELSLVQRYMFIVIPVVAIVALVVLSKKDDIFMNAMTYMIGTALAAYLLFALFFIVKTANYIPSYFSGLVEGMMNPVNAMLGVPMGFVLGMQKVLQTVETGLGCLAMSAQQSDSEPREAGAISLIPSIMTLFIAIFITSYIASYGIEQGIINYGTPNDAMYRLSSFFNTASSVTGNFGLIVMSLFTVLSAMTTILGSYYYLRKLFKKNAVNKNIVIYLTLIITAGTLAIFGANVVFEAVDLLLFVCSGINLVALTVFAYKTNKAIKNGNVKDVNKVA
ncbi:alanine:cation symporter family protein [Romboutsia sp. 13368]|uniref:alanine:cation symporter family protein n=1 Tax=Romboutsia sp. 13368 TaxID=2708053 RepID=UPI0025D45D61|nr:alanine:cation symporter family protein [Romboutsia sp. 13368]